MNDSEPITEIVGKTAASDPFVSNNYEQLTLPYELDSLEDDKEPTKTPRLGRITKMAGRVTLCAMAGIGGMLAAGHEEVEIATGSAEVSLSLSPSGSGGTVVDLTPIGKAEFSTHDGVLSTQIRPKELGLESAANYPDYRTLQKDIDIDIGKGISEARNKILLKGGFGFIGGAGAVAVAGSIISRRRDPERPGAWRKWGLAGAATLPIVGVLGGWAYVSRADAELSNAKLSGDLNEYEPLRITFDSIINDKTRFDAQIENIVNYGNSLFVNLQDMELLPDPDKTTSLMVVSDEHCYPNVHELIATTAEVFDIDGVISAGDLTDFGTTFEGECVEGIERIDAPVYVALGNHDSDATRRQLEQLDNVTILDGQTESINEISVVGMPDPRHTSDELRSIGNDDEEYELSDSAGFEQLELELKQAIINSEAVESIAIVHDPRVNGAIAGSVPVIINGHTHKQEIKELDGSMVINPGSVGGGGLRAFDSEQAVQRTALILYFDNSNQNLTNILKINWGVTGELAYQLEYCEVEPSQQLNC